MSEKILKQLHPYLEYLARELKREMITRHGVEIIIFNGYRSTEYQNKLYSYGRTDKSRSKVTNAPGGFSYHNFRLAFDVCPIKNGKCNWNDIDSFNKIGEIGVEIGLEWGGNFKSINDKPHLQWRDGLHHSDLRAGKLPSNPLDSAMKFEYKEKIDYIFDKKLIKGYNYVNLRELLGKLGFKIDYDVITRTVIIKED